MKSRRHALMLFVICLGLCQCIKIIGREIWSGEVRSATASFALAKPIHVYEGMIVRVDTKTGFTTWAEVLENYEDLSGTLILTQADGTVTRFGLSLKGNSENVSGCRHQRSDNKSDLAWRLHKDLPDVVAVKIEFQQGIKSIQFPFLLTFQNNT